MKVGDRVRIKPLSYFLELYGETFLQIGDVPEVGWCSDMTDIASVQAIGTVVRIVRGHVYVRFQETPFVGLSFHYMPSWFVPVPTIKNMPKETKGGNI